MASEFYEQLGVDRAASSTKIRTAYSQHVARLARRRKALVEQGGDTTQLDLVRARLDEAWEVLSDPLRRRRYDVLLRWTDGAHNKTVEGLWEEVSDGLVHPAAAVGAKLLRVTSRLSEIGSLPLAPSGSADEPPTLVPHDEDLTAPRAARLGAPPARDAAGSGLRLVDGSAGASDVLVLPQRQEPSHLGSAPPPEMPAEPPGPSGADTAPPAPALAPQAPPSPPGAPAQARSAPPSATPSIPGAPALPPGLPADELGLLVDQLGYGGALLQAVRMRMGLSLQDLSDHTRISVRYLEALESETRDSLPTATFVRGYVREVARMLKLPADAVVAGYLRRLDA
jgi:hypothetical protein